MHTRSFELAIDLIHAMAGRGTLSVVAAKEAVCGSTIPATDFRRALAYAQGAAWIQYERDFLSITLRRTVTAPCRSAVPLGTGGASREHRREAKYAASPGPTSIRTRTRSAHFANDGPAVLSRLPNRGAEPSRRLHDAQRAADARVLASPRGFEPRSRP